MIAALLIYLWPLPNVQVLLLEDVEDWIAGCGTEFVQDIDVYVLEVKGLQLLSISLQFSYKNAFSANFPLEVEISLNVERLNAYVAPNNANVVGFWCFFIFSSYIFEMKEENEEHATL